MQPRCAGRREPASQRERIVLETADFLELALTEADRAPTEEIDGGDY